jgi:hypothetical protein
MHNLPTYAERVNAARERITAALEPSTRQHQAAVAHLFRCVGDLPTLETLALLLDRAVSSARAEAYERGWREAGGQP